jgi:quaternary ammonium compound-resistance protein SugE
MFKTIHWFYLFLASVLEVCWIYSVKFLDFKKVMNITWKDLLSDYSQCKPLIPLIGYLFFGLTNIILFSFAMRKIPASTAFAVWMALALVGAKIVEVAWFKESFSWANLFFVVLILVGIIGLKTTTAM